MIQTNREVKSSTTTSTKIAQKGIGIEAPISVAWEHAPQHIYIIPKRKLKKEAQTTSCLCGGISIMSGVL